jgi:hypothetical protein
VSGIATQPVCAPGANAFGWLKEEAMILWPMNALGDMVSNYHKNSVEENDYPVPP